MLNQLALTLDIAQEAENQGLQGTQYRNSADAGAGVIIGNIMSIVMLVAVLLVFIFLIVGAIQWLTSGGDKGKIENAQKRITNAVIGLFILAATAVIFMLLQSFLGINVLNFTGGSNTALPPDPTNWTSV
ncbi:MAG TPA: hypothetical protein PLQ50_00990 [Candidatus Woesebacteria bacterium]|nr:hypothetical protein [Candidatus Woesebacteria bacterium]